VLRTKKIIKKIKKSLKKYLYLADFPTKSSTVETVQGDDLQKSSTTDTKNLILRRLKIVND